MHILFCTKRKSQEILSSGAETLQPPVTTDVPKTSPEALNFLLSLVPEEDFKYLMFDDALVTVSDTGKELGEFTVTVEPAKHRGQECFLVHANSHGAIDGVPCGTSIVCHVAKNMDTLEQHHHEYVKLENCPLDRKTIITKTNESYVINRVITQGEDVQRTSRSVPVEAMRGFISEGSNLLLHRLFMEKGLQEELQFVSFDSETNLCPAIYRALEERTQSVEGVEIHVYGVERTINSTVDLPTTWQSYFMTDGHLTNRVQIGSPVTMKLIHLPAMIERDEETPKPVFEKKPLNWEEDVQMYSKFLDRKEELKGDHAVYMRHHPELKALLADFLQFLLLRKPQDVIAFAAEYFSAFSPTMPETTPYLSSAAPSPFPHSHTNTQIESLRAPTH
ncbi:ciliogenesis-associated TTC17-interacting protein-like isoform X2 [Pomacea canaliculata]|uniref:ciliogenesis-associated TTC17-interacting protein-like isoform X2 n=1 Tax=Pomacea canaliculata TaxID=400727 RepID=UPI000D72DE19|nr:ciliogenesis-associated TTC17-interacting protein-like isoform X2 [Pomacea canaliculata]